MYRDNNSDNTVMYTQDDLDLFRESPFAVWMERLTLENPDHGILPDFNSEWPPRREPQPADIADTLLTMAKTGGQAEGGLFHYSGAPNVSWAGFAREIVSQAGHATQITDIPTTDYPTPAPRPLNSRLECSRLNEIYGLGRPDWKVGLAQVLAELKVTDSPALKG